MKTLAIMATKISSFLLKQVGRGGSLPGSIGCRLDNDILKKLSFEGPVILVTGTNGKTSTANMISDLFSHAGYKVLSNRKGDNLKAGIVTALLTQSTLTGKIKANAIILEVDELNVRHILPYLPVKAFVVNNFFRDQLDRAREMEQLIESIESVLPSYQGELILNGNDPNVMRLSLVAKKAHCTTFGLAKNEYSTTSTQEASEGKFCPECGHRLEYDYYQYSHIGSFHCPQCGFKTPKLDVCLEDIDLSKETFVYQGNAIHSPYEGMYSMYNCAAVLAVAKHFQLQISHALAVFKNAPQPKGRNEHFHKDNQICILNLIKNPTGANEVMKVIEKDNSEKIICIVLNDHEQDGTDVSWIYDTFFEKVCHPSTKKIICTGTRAYDMALRIYYENFKDPIEIYDTIEEAISHSLSEHVTCYAIATYTALLPTRNAIIKELNI